MMKPQKLEETIALSKKIVMENQKRQEAGGAEFVFGQMRFISLQTWLIKGAIFLCMVCVMFLFSVNGAEHTDQMLSIATPVLVLSSMPEFYKNIRFHATDVELCTRFGLKRAYLARFLLLGMYDLCMATVWILMGSHWLDFSLLQLVIRFLVPYNSTLLVCLTVMTVQKSGTEYLSETAGAVWMAVMFWSARYMKIYEKVQTFLWIVLIGVSCIFIGFAMKKIMDNTGHILEVDYAGNEAG